MDFKRDNELIADDYNTSLIILYKNLFFKKCFAAELFLYFW